MKPMRNTKITHERDFPMLQFIWMYKVVSSSILAWRFFSKSKPRTCWRRLYMLRKAEYIQLITLKNGSGNAWSLTAKGYNVVKESLPELREGSYLSDKPNHDLVVLAAHSGNYLSNATKHIQFVTDQQLKSFHEDCLPEWVPSSQSQRPDGYWRVKSGNSQKTVALEVELNTKSKSRYKKIAQFYSDNTEIDEVIWITDNYSACLKIQKCMFAKNKARFHIHSFVELDDFKKSIWNAKLSGGINNGKTVAQALLVPHATVDTIATIPVLTHIFFNYCILPVNSESYKAS